jgi:CRISPR-associated endonuclease/helicase Cas3
MSYEQFFQHATDGLTPYPWQVEVAKNGLPEVLSVPTGLGKTEGTVLTWAYRLLRMEGTGEPRHLIYCLPMRVLVQQTRERLRACFDRLQKQDGLDVGVHVLMGGDADEAWTRDPRETMGIDRNTRHAAFPSAQPRLWDEPVRVASAFRHAE